MFFVCLFVSIIWLHKSIKKKNLLKTHILLALLKHNFLLALPKYLQNNETLPPTQKSLSKSLAWHIPMMSEKGF